MLGHGSWHAYRHLVDVSDLEERITGQGELWCSDSTKSNLLGSAWPSALALSCSICFSSLGNWLGSQKLENLEHLSFFLDWPLACWVLSPKVSYSGGWTHEHDSRTSLWIKTGQQAGYPQFSVRAQSCSFFGDNSKRTGAHLHPCAKSLTVFRNPGLSTHQGFPYLLLLFKDIDL